jgi:hypothetical protein
MKMKSETLKEKIAQLQSELKEAQKEEQQLASGSPVAIANLLHEKMCHHNHIDGCSWGYETWDMPKGTRADYVKRARKLLANCKAEGIHASQLVAIIEWIFE